MKQLALALGLALATTLAAASPASAFGAGGGCDDWGCGMNGPQLTGLQAYGAALENTRLQETTAEGPQQQLTAPGQAGVSAVILPSGETVDLR